MAAIACAASGIAATAVLRPPRAGLEPPPPAAAETFFGQGQPQLRGHPPRNARRTREIPANHCFCVEIGDHWSGVSW